MRVIIVDDEPVMVRYFTRECQSFPELSIKGAFTSAEKRWNMQKKTQLWQPFDVEMPHINGIELAVNLRKLRPDILVVFVSAYDYVRDSNKIGADYYIRKPYVQEMLEHMMQKLRLLAKRQRKKVYLHMFGTFTVTYDGKSVPLKGRAKEVLAYISAFRGKEVSNQIIYATLWNDKSQDNSTMTLYFHALRKLKDTLLSNGIGDLLISNARGQMLNADIVDCDFFAWQDKNAEPFECFKGEFLSEYSWSEPMLADLLYYLNI